MGIEDQRAAATIQVSISSFVLTAGLAIIAAEGALFTFYLDKRIIEPLGIAALILTPVFVVASFIAGGTAMNKLSTSGYGGTWNIQDVGRLFNAQAILTLLAVVGIMLSVLGTRPKSDVQSQEARLVRFNDELYRLKQQIRRVEVRIGCPSACSASKRHRLPPH